MIEELAPSFSGTPHAKAIQELGGVVGDYEFVEALEIEQGWKVNYLTEK